MAKKVKKKKKIKPKLQRNAKQKPSNKRLKQKKTKKESAQSDLVGLELVTSSLRSIQTILIEKKNLSLDCYSRWPLRMNPRFPRERIISSDYFF